MKSFYTKKTLRNFNRSFFNPPPAYRIRIAFPNHSSFQISLRRGCAVHSIFQRGESSFVFRAKTIYPPDYRASTQLRARTGRIYNREDSYLRCKLDIPRYVLFVLDSNLSNAGSITRQITRHSRNPPFSLFYDSIVHWWIRSNLSQYTRTIYFSARCPNFPPFPDTADRYAARSIRAMAIKMGEGEKRGAEKTGENKQRRRKP